MKFIKIATTISFMVVFAFLATNYDHLYSNTVTTKIVEKSQAPEPQFNKIPKPGPGGMFDISDGVVSKHKGMPTPAPDVYKSDPPVLKSTETITITSKSEYNEYVKKGVGAAVGLAVKDICVWFFGLAKNLFRRRFA